MTRSFLFALSLLAAGPLVAQEGSVPAGEALFAGHCAACHGAEAVGDGPMTQLLRIVPPDLTTLTGPDGFQLADVVRRIDGRDLLAHGGPMPVFGAILGDNSAVVDGADGSPVFTSQAVLDIALWLETIQR